MLFTLHSCSLFNNEGELYAQYIVENKRNFNVPSKSFSQTGPPSERIRKIKIKITYLRFMKMHYFKSASVFQSIIVP
jgi:hypothetical protein